jgi:hypothetical protein
MTFDGAVIKEQGITFGIAVVRRGVIDNPHRRRDALAGFQAALGGVPTVLAEQDTKGRPTYYGRPDIVNFLSGVPFDAIPWRHYSLTP